MSLCRVYVWSDLCCDVGDRSGPPRPGQPRYILIISPRTCRGQRVSAAAGRRDHGQGGKVSPWQRSGHLVAARVRVGSPWVSGGRGRQVRVWGRRHPGLCCDGDFTMIRTRIGSGTPAWRHKGPPVETKDWESRGEPVAPCSSNITEIFWILDYRIFNSKLIQVENIWHFSCNANWISWVLSGILWFCIPLKVWHNNSCTIQFYIRW